SAEHDRASTPYRLATDAGALVRMPIATDDWDYARPSSTGAAVGAKHARLIRSTAQRRSFLAPGYHPWLLAGRPRGLQDWERTLDQAMEQGLRICTFRDLLGDGS